ncbi:hypothetical protein IGL98_001977 [Enterococcus sp. DIV0840]|uniref:type IV pilin protein n=1 Tax=Enterococcus TaxID=1350 RepID=UPI001A8DDBBC|nr:MULTISPECIES: prepilin-type N-terminal cleavage/methylation domain-containing protein [Enterococcus]MBO0432947.1 prepilin-type N-terminal cleavage/methylation domain-containing protein [Enterococcus sp. DIV0849a]MBO0475016.1 prepilin-type N-terminal cleavage/methylation domain-containing protein [Enterococcus ureasiticus]
MLKKILKDERGLSLVELLAVVVIMAIIAGIGAVAISSVIQKNREDAGISNVQSLMQSANLYQMSEKDAPITTAGGSVNAKTLEEKNYISQIGFLSNGEGVTFKANSDGKILMTIEGEILSAGSKKNVKITDVTEDQVAKLTRDELWKTGIGSSTPPAS